MTEQSSEQFGRRSIRLKEYDYSQAGGYSLTIETRGRECLFGKVTGGEIILSRLGQIADGCLRSIPEHFTHVGLDVFVVMPNHVHGILFIHQIVGAQHIVPAHLRDAAPLCAPLRGMTSNVKSGSLGAIVRSFKSNVTRRAGLELNSGNIWQRNYYEHILRDEADYERITGYIFDNPLNWDQDEENPKNR